MADGSICYLNGEFLPLIQASVPVLDRGFIFGDGVYEMIPVFAGNAFRLDEHLQRLADSLAAVHIRNPQSQQQWASLINELVRKNHAPHQAIYLQVTRGVAHRDHAIPDDLEPTIFLMSSPLADTRDANPVTAAVIEDPRWDNCSIKAISLLPNVLLRQQAREQGAYEAILIKDGYLTEGAASNVFIVKDSVVKTPPKSKDILPGITRDLVVELLGVNNISCEETSVSEAELRQADEIWVTSSTKEVLPVIQLDGKNVGAGEPGVAWQQVVAFYQGFKDSFTGSGAVSG